MRWKDCFLGRWDGSCLEKMHLDRVVLCSLLPAGLPGFGGLLPTPADKVLLPLGLLCELWKNHCPYMPTPTSTFSAGLATVFSLPLTTSEKLTVCTQRVCFCSSGAKSSSYFCVSKEHELRHQALHWNGFKLCARSVQALSWDWYCPEGQKGPLVGGFTPVWEQVPGRCHKVWEDGKIRK